MEDLLTALRALAQVNTTLNQLTLTPASTLEETVQAHLTRILRAEHVRLALLPFTPGQALLDEASFREVVTETLAHVAEWHDGAVSRYEFWAAADGLSLNLMPEAQYNPLGEHARAFGVLDTSFVADEAALAGYYVQYLHTMACACTPLRLCGQCGLPVLPPTEVVLVRCRACTPCLV
ncbi:hypothetical protein [Deinococcus sp. Leaf326]|uniref:hypothetical protein n=1 Tax=Deinococcus sp. Leaf326 TaxID=1736338 RepID=UPI0006FB8F0A|nr:hypothetical protein [Deinococcus sp. Leaf326]KQR25544.1 hypothetical protein ASF71_19270 [Deinococcus sp. Leaf326]